MTFSAQDSTDVPPSIICHLQGALYPGWVAVDDDKPILGTLGTFHPGWDADTHLHLGTFRVINPRSDMLFGERYRKLESLEKTQMDMGRKRKTPNQCESCVFFVFVPKSIGVHKLLQSS